MAAISFSDLGGGLDLRRDPALSAGNVLTRLSNAYINTAKATQKRPCLVKVATLETGTVGLRSAGGKLNTFYGQGVAITHANLLFRANRTPHPTNGALAITRVNYGENFNGILYASVTYSNGDTKHHYLDDTTATAWVASTVYGLAAFRRPTVANGLLYESTVAGTSDASEPTWPLTIGGTVVDGTVTWTARSNAITDANCPNSRIVKKLKQKIYAADGSNVAFCKTGDPRDWTSANDAGFIPSGIQAPGSDTVTALGDYGGDLVVFYADSLQVWRVDADPTANVLRTSSSNTGTIYADAAQTLAGDLIFLSQQGFRSVSLVALTTDNLQENDVGSAIDSLRDEIEEGDTPATIYYPRLGQLWCLNAKDGVTKIYVYSFSKAVKLSAWQIYEFTVATDAVAVHNNQLYIRVADDVYRVDNNAFADETTDAPTPPLVEMETFYQDCKTPGILKMFWGFDGLIKGSAEIAFKWQHKLNDGHVVYGETDWQPVVDDLRPGAIQPMEICAVAVAIKVRHRDDEDFRCSNLTLYYENLGPMA